MSETVYRETHTVEADGDDTGWGLYIGVVVAVVAGVVIVVVAVCFFRWWRRRNPEGAQEGEGEGDANDDVPAIMDANAPSGGPPAAPQSSSTQASSAVPLLRRILNAFAWRKTVQKKKEEVVVAEARAEQKEAEEQPVTSGQRSGAFYTALSPGISEGGDMSGTHAVAGFSLSPLPGLTLEPEASAGRVAWNDSGEGLLGVAAGGAAGGVQFPDTPVNRPTEQVSRLARRLRFQLPAEECGATGGEESRPPPGMGGLDTGRSGEPNAAADGDPVGVQEVGDGKGGERVDVWTRSQERRLGAVSKRSSTPMATTAELAELGASFSPVRKHPMSERAGAVTPISGTVLERRAETPWQIRNAEQNADNLTGTDSRDDVGTLRAVENHGVENAGSVTGQPVTVELGAKSVQDAAISLAEDLEVAGEFLEQDPKRKKKKVVRSFRRRSRYVASPLTVARRTASLRSSKRLSEDLEDRLHRLEILALSSLEAAK